MEDRVQSRDVVTPKNLKPHTKARLVNSFLTSPKQQDAKSEAFKSPILLILWTLKMTYRSNYSTLGLFFD